VNGKFVLARNRESLIAVGRVQDVVAVFLKVLADEIADAILVFD